MAIFKHILGTTTKECMQYFVSQPLICIEQGSLHKRRYTSLFLLLAPNNGLSVKANIDARTRPEKRVGYRVFNC